MREPVVVDSTCLIALERIDQLEVLPALFHPVLVPPAVEAEFSITLPWLQVEAPTNQGLILAVKILVDEGEAEAIALAQERGSRIVLDDRRARSVGRNMGLSVIGTVGILLLAKQAGIRPAVRPLLDDLERNGFYLAAALREEALRLAGEHGER